MIRRCVTVLAGILLCVSFANGCPCEPGTDAHPTRYAGGFGLQGNRHLKHAHPCSTRSLHRIPDFEGRYVFGEAITQFKIVSVIKGKISGDTVAFRHYEDSTTTAGAKFGSGDGEIRYHFEPGRIYLVLRPGRREPGNSTGKYRRSLASRLMKASCVAPMTSRSPRIRSKGSFGMSLWRCCTKTGIPSISSTPCANSIK